MRLGGKPPIGFQGNSRKCRSALAWLRNGASRAWVSS